MPKLLVALSLLCAGLASAHAADPVPAACRIAYEQIRAGKLAEAVDSMAQCAKATPADKRQTVMLYERAMILDKLERPGEALAQLIALTDKAYFETGLADEFSGPGAWSRDPEMTRQRQATGINRADLLLDIAWRKLRNKDVKAAIDWSERSAKHALTRFKPESEHFPMDRDAGCAMALRGFARADSGDNQRAMIDLMRGYIRGCEKLPVAEKAGLLADDSRKKVEELKQQFNTLQAEVRWVTEENISRNKAISATGSLHDVAIKTTIAISHNLKAVEPVMKKRREFLAAEAAVLGPEPLFEEAAKP